MTVTGNGAGRLGRRLAALREDRDHDGARPDSHRLHGPGHGRLLDPARHGDDLRLPRDRGLAGLRFRQRERHGGGRRRRRLLPRTWIRRLHRARLLGSALRRRRGRARRRQRPRRQYGAGLERRDRREPSAAGQSVDRPSRRRTTRRSRTVSSSSSPEPGAQSFTASLDRYTPQTQARRSSPTTRSAWTSASRPGGSTQRRDRSRSRVQPGRDHRDGRST